jgi:hypothetical protein
MTEADIANAFVAVFENGFLPRTRVAAGGSARIS